MRERNVTALKLNGRGTRGCRLEGIRALATGLAAGLIVFAVQPAEATEAAPVKIAVFDFELNDASAAGGVVAQDAIDTENLTKSTDEARNMLSATGRYALVDTGSAAADVASAGGIRHCNGCDAPLAKKLGAAQSMAGVVTRVSRTEYSLLILVRDAETGAIVSRSFSGLRMGANYSWPRSVKSLMKNGILAAPPAQ
jgi:hypothetical protein